MSKKLFGDLTFGTRFTFQFWDDVLGPTSADANAVAKAAKKLPAADTTKASDLNVSHWAAEGLQNTKDSVYSSQRTPMANVSKKQETITVNAVGRRHHLRVPDSCCFCWLLPRWGWSSRGA